MTSTITPVAAAAMALAGLALAAPGAHAEPKRTPLYVSVLAPPSAVVGTDGRRHLAYELLIQNQGDSVAEVEALTIRARDGRRLQTIAGAAVPEAMRNVAGEPTRTLGRTEGGYMWLDLTLPRHAAVPRALVHQVRVRSTFPDGSGAIYRFRAGFSPVDRRPPVRLTPPLHGGLYVDFNGCCVHSAHRNAITAMNGTPFISQRYAADFLRVDADGLGAAGDLSHNSSFFTYGQPVLAVADARVVYTLDSVLENVPFIEPPGRAFTTRTIVGNHVVLKIGPGHFATYGHLQRGSLRVHVGQRVKRGQVLARVGNTGQSGAPHLHLQVTDGPIPLTSHPLPFVFDRFRLAGEVDNLDAFMTGQAPAHVVRTARTGRRSGEMPLQDAVLGFGR